MQSTHQKQSTREAWFLLFALTALYVVVTAYAQSFSIIGGIAIGQVLCFMLPSVLYARWKTVSVRNALRLRPVPRGAIWRATLLALTGVGVFDLVERASQPIIAHYFGGCLPVLEAIEEVLTPETPEGLIGVLFVVGLLAPVCEELLFRGAFQGTLEQIGPVRAIAFSAILFGLIHLNPFNFVAPILFGAMAGFLTWRTGSLLPAILWHAVNNSLATLANFFGGPGFGPPLWLDAFSSLVFGLLVWESIRYTRSVGSAGVSCLSTTPPLIRGRAFCFLNAVAIASVVLVIGAATCFGRASLGNDRLAPDFRAGDLVVYVRSPFFRASELQEQDVIIFRDDRPGIRFTRILQLDGDELTVVRSRSADGDWVEMVIGRSDVVGKVIWRFDPGEETKQLMRDIKKKRAARRE